MALLDTMKEIEERREKTLNRRQQRMEQGEPVNKMPISRDQLRLAMSRMDQVFKYNRAEELKRREQQERVAQAVANMQQQEAAAQQGQAQPQQPQQAQPQMQQGQSGLMGQVAPMMNAGAMGGMGQAQPQPQQQQQQAPQQPQGQQQAPQNASQGLLGMSR